MTKSESQISLPTWRVFNAPRENPFDLAVQPDHYEIWEALIARDSDAFAAIDWSMCEADFATDRFDGISAHGSLNPMDWNLRYPTVESYRDDWTRMAHEYLAVPLAEISHHDLLYRMQHIERVDVASDRAMVLKQFRATEPLTTGGEYNIQAQSVYRLHKVDGRWLIAGFVGYLPLAG